MIPEFPQFKPLELSDRDEVERHTSKYPPYSDFNFVSMWSWDVKGEMSLSILNNNLVVRFTDYINGQPFFSFLGDNLPNETASTLLDFAKANKLPEQLKLVPEASVSGLNPENFKIIEDRDNFDYIYEVEKLSLFKGSDYHIKRNEISKFLRHTENVFTQQIDLTDLKIRTDLLNLNYKWLENKKTKDPFFDIKNELVAIERFLSMNSKGLQAFGVFSKDELIAYSINEVCSEKCAIGHFYKSSTYNGIFSFLMRETARFIKGFGVKYLNFEQDLGVDNLRTSKQSYKPKNYLKKYLVARS